MNVSKITYGRSFQLTEGHWEKIGVEIEMHDTDDPEKARVLAKELVEHIYTQNNPGLPLSAFQPPPPLPVREDNSVTKIFDRHLQETKEQIEACTFHHEAEAILIASGTIRFNKELNDLVNSKPKIQ